MRYLFLVLIFISFIYVFFIWFYILIVLVRRYFLRDVVGLFGLVEVWLFVGRSVTKVIGSF